MLIVGVVVVSVCFSPCVSSPPPPLAEVRVRTHHDVTLECRGPGDAEISLLEWSRPELPSGRYVFLYRNQRPYEKYQHESFRGRVQLRDPNMKDGDASVVLRNVSVGDAGTYECRARTRSSSEEKHFLRLTVTASAVVEKATKEGGGTSGLLSVGVPAAVLLLVPAAVFGLLLFRKLRKKYTKALKIRFSSPHSVVVGPADLQRSASIRDT